MRKESSSFFPSMWMTFACFSYLIPMASTSNTLIDVSKERRSKAPLFILLWHDTGCISLSFKNTVLEEAVLGSHALL